MQTLPAFTSIDILMLLIFFVGYLLITIEHITKVNKAAISIIIAILCWILTFANHSISDAEKESFLWHHVSDTSQVIFFLLGAMAIVEIINSHNGFAVITNFIRVSSKSLLLWIVSFVAFFLSAVIDNLTTTIVMIILLRKLLPAGEDRLLFGGAIVIAANAGGAWTPIGDVTTTMLWIGGQITPIPIMRSLFLPSLVCLILPCVWLSLHFRGKTVDMQSHSKQPLNVLSYWAFFLGIGLLLFVPIFKTLTGLPPFMAILFGLAILWIATDLIYRRNESADATSKSIAAILTRIDHSTILFFLGILLSINALDAAHILNKGAEYLTAWIARPEYVAIALGLVSAVVDNVPLVAGAMGMYEISQFPVNAPFWRLLAFCAGTGGSMLIIGSAAGVAFMGMEHVNFFWYMRRVGWLALIGYFAGIAVFFLMSHR